MNLRLSPRHAGRDPAHVLILAFDGVDELDLFGVYSILSKARNSVVAEVVIASPERSVRASGGVDIPTQPIGDHIAGCGVLVVPGGSGAWDTARAGTLSDAVKCAYRDGARIYCCCSGALIVAAALMPRQGRMAIHARKKQNLRAFFGGEIVSGIVESDGITTIGGQPFEGVKSVLVAFRILNDLDATVSQRVAERTEISWSPADALR